VQLDETYTLLVDSLIEKTQAIRAGEVWQQEGDEAVGAMIVGEVFHARTCTVLKFTQRPAQEACVAFAGNFLAGGHFKTLLVLDTLTRTAHISSVHAPPGSVRAVPTSAACEQFRDAFLHIEKLEVGNVVSGLSAAFIAYAEARGISAAAFIVLREPYRTIETLNAAASLVPVISQAVAEEVGVPSVNAIRAFVRQDPFVQDTANLYT
jgi:hypothetical protein